MTNGESLEVVSTRGKTSRSSRMRGNRNDRFESALQCWNGSRSRDVNDRALKTRHK